MIKETKYKFDKRKTISTNNLNNFCIYAKEHDFIEVSEWANGEGYDLDINGAKHISMTWGEFRALKKLIKKLEKSYE